MSAGWRYGQVLDPAPNLRAIFTVSGGWPPGLDYAGCFARDIRVLSVAPAFAAAVAEMALALALASAATSLRRIERCAQGRNIG